MDDSTFQSLWSQYRWPKLEVNLELDHQKKDSHNKSSKGLTSHWEWQKNIALMELERRNVKLVKLLNETAEVALKLDSKCQHDQKLLMESLKREKERNFLVKKCNIFQSLLIRQARKMTSFKLLRRVFCSWCQFCMLMRRKKILRKAEKRWHLMTLAKWFYRLTTFHTVTMDKTKVRRKIFMHWKSHIKKTCFSDWKKRSGSCREMLKPARWCKSVSRKTAKLRFARIASVKGHNHFERGRRMRRNNLMLSMWKRWNDYLRKSKENARVAEILYFRVTVGKCFEIWKHLNHLKHARAATYKEMVEQRMHVLKKKLFYGWYNEFSRKRKINTRYDTFVKLSGRYYLLKAFFKWWQIIMRTRNINQMKLTWQRRKSMKIQKNVFWFLKLGWRRKRLLMKFIAKRNSKLRLAVLGAWLKHLEHCKKVTLWSNQKHRRGKLRLWLLSHKAQELDLEAKRLNDELQTSYECGKELQIIFSSFRTRRQDMLGIIEVEIDQKLDLFEVDLQWHFIQPHGEFKPPALAGHSAVALAQQENGFSSRWVVFYGGYNREKYFSDVILFDSVSRKWIYPKLSVEEGSAFPPPVKNHTACAFNNQMIIFGGCDGAREFADISVLLFSENDLSCKWVQPEIGFGASPPPISQHTSCVYDNGPYMVVFGGYSASRGHLNEIWILDLIWLTWTFPECFGTPPSPRRGHAATIIGKTMFVFGGYNGDSHFNDIFSLDLEKMIWHPLKTEGEAPSRRRHHSLVAAGNHLVMYGGYNGREYLDDVYTLDIELYVWKRWNVAKPSMNYRVGNGEECVFARSLHTMVLANQSFIVFGGVHEHGAVEDVLLLQSNTVSLANEAKNLCLEEHLRYEFIEKKMLKLEEAYKQKTKSLARSESIVSQLQTDLQVAEIQRKKLIQNFHTIKRKLEKSRSVYKELN